MKLLILLGLLLAQDSWAGATRTIQANVFQGLPGFTLDNSGAVITPPSSTSTLATLALTEALSNKTLTSCTLDGSLNTVSNIPLGTATGTLAIGHGGTGQVTAQAAIDALAGLTTQGDILYRNATNAVRKSLGSAGTILRSNGTDLVYGQAVLTTDVTGVLPVANGGTNASTTQGAINSISQLTTRGDLLYRDATNSTRLPLGATARLLRSDGTDAAWAQANLTTDVTGLLPAANGGTGVTLPSANQVLGVNSGATGYEGKTITAGSNVTVTHGANSITIASSAASGGTYIGGCRWIGTTACQWSRTSTSSWADYSADADCTSPTGGNLFGSGTAPGTKIPACTFSSLASGAYIVFATGPFDSSAGCAWAIYNGTVRGGTQTANTGDSIGNIVGVFSSMSGTTTFSVQATGNNTSSQCDINANIAGNEIRQLDIHVFKF